ncbi:MAG: hypothetical protein KF692_01840 [Cryobacterium sp.]|nr:hypothetical protein [Cryobacterium sp.]
MTRARAYRWLGENHWIPGIHGSSWLGGDLRNALSELDLGAELELDYRGQTPDAPRIAVRRSENDVLTAQGPDGWLNIPGHVQWAWPPSEQADRLEQIAFTLLSFLKERRGAPHVVLIAPR